MRACRGVRLDVDSIKDALDRFEERWNEAKASGKTAVLFEQDKWNLIDMLLDEAKKTRTMRRQLISLLASKQKGNEENDGKVVVLYRSAV